MKTRLIVLGVGIGLFLCAMLGAASGNSNFLWLLLPSFVMVGLGADHKLWHRTREELVPEAVWFAPNS